MTTPDPQLRLGADPACPLGAVSRDGAVAVLHLEGVVDTERAAALDGVIAALDARDVVIDLDACTIATARVFETLATARLGGTRLVLACSRLAPRLAVARHHGDRGGAVYESVRAAVAALQDGAGGGVLATPGRRSEQSVSAAAAPGTPSPAGREEER